MALSVLDDGGEANGNCPWSLDSPRRPLEGNPALLMVLARLGMYKRGPRLLDLSPFLRPKVSEFPRTGLSGNRVNRGNPLPRE
jgi:hypothetical protein